MAEKRRKLEKRKGGEELREKSEKEKRQEVRSRITAIEKKLERKERRRNIIIKGVDLNEKNKEKVVEGKNW